MDRDIYDIALCASFPCIAGRFSDAVGASPEAAFINKHEEYRGPLTVGRAY